MGLFVVLALALGADADLGRRLFNRAAAVV
jgi:hypothetical protein